jgi:tetratricopeptide (TPR) repeat protein
METGVQTWNQSQALELLEREGRFPELAAELAALSTRAEGAEKAAVLARLGEVSLRLDDIARAVTAFSASLELEPTQPTSRRWLEVLLAEPEHALAAAEALEPVFQAEFRTVAHSASMLLAILELKANRCVDQDERIAIWVQLGALFDHAALPPERAREIAVRLLSRTAAEWPGGVGKWIERVARLSPDSNQRIEALLAAIGQPLTDPLTISELGLAAGHELQAVGRHDEARPLYERALGADPTSPEVLGRLDAMAESAGEGGEQRAERYRAAIERAEEPERRAALRVAFGLLQKNVLDDLEAAAGTLRSAIAESPGMFRAHEALVEVYGALQDDAALERELERALAQFEGGEWRLTLARLGEALLARGRASEALARTKPLLDEMEIDGGTLELLERLADDVGDLETSRRVHERRMELAPEGFARAGALESLGEFMNERMHDPAAAAAAWKRAAELLAQNADENSEPERLYERVLQVTPNDAEAARRLVELCARGADWTKVPGACRALLDASKDALSVVEVVLSLEGRAAQTSGADEFANIVDEVASRLDDAHDAETRALVAAKARVMASSARFDEAALVYEALIESYADEQDVRAYVGLIESSPDSDWRHAKRSWLFEWRAARSEDPVAVLTHWATVEEQEFSDIPAAIALLERATTVDAKRPEVWRELSRLRIASGETAQGLVALGRLRELGGEGDASTVELTMAELMIERLDEPVDALPLLESVLKTHADHPRARELILTLTKNPLTSLRAAELFERASLEADTPDMQRDVLSSLLEATEQAAREASADKQLATLRRRWFERLVGLESGERALSVFERAAAEFPTDDSIWQAVEAGAVRQKTPEAALRAYEGALSRTHDPALAEALGRRLVAFAAEHVGNPRALTAPLERLLSVTPTARWAFDRIKLPLTSEQRWEALFGLYERVIGALEDPGQRAGLLDEAAVAARDLANDPERAIGYWQSYFALRPDDARVDLALERLYERQQKLELLIEHLTRREARLEADELIRSRERIAGLWIDLKNARSALTVVESLPKSASLNESTLLLLESIFKLEALDADAESRKITRRAARLLKQRYTSLERPASVAQVLVRELTSLSDQKERVKLLKQLAELRQTLSEEAEEFESLGELMLLEPKEEEHRKRLAELALKLDNRARLAQLIVLAAERVGDGAEFAALLAEAAGILLELADRDRAIELFSRILEEAKDEVARLDAARRLEKLLLDVARPAERCTVLERLAALTSEAKEKRDALLEAARVALEELSDPARAAAEHRILLENEPNDRSLLDGLLKALRAGERWDEVIVALVRRAELEPTAPSARADLGDAARTRAERLADVEGAIVAWREIRERFGRDAESFQLLSQLYETSGRYAELAELLGDEASASPDPAPLYARLADVHRRHTGDLQSALGASVRAGDLVAAAELFCDHGELVPDDPSLALELAKRLGAAGSAAIAERVLHRQIEHYGPRRPREGARVHLALAELLVATAREPMALRELAAAAERYPESGTILSALGALALQLGELDRAEQSYRGLLLLLGRAHEEGEVVLGRAHVYLYLSEVAAQRGDGQRQQDHIASAFESGLGSEEEALALEDALREHGRPDLVERAVTARLERARDPAKVALALRDLLELHADSTPVEASTAERALRLAERAARDLESAGGSQTNAWHALLDVFVRLDEKERVLSVLEALAARSTTEAEHAEYDLLIAHRLLALPDRREDAIERLWTLVRKDAANSEPYELLTELLTEGASYEPLLELLRAQLDAAEAALDVARAEVLAQRLGVALERGGRVRDALQAYARLGKHESRRREALEKVVELHERLGTHGGELADALEALLGIETEPERAAELALRLAELRRQEWDEEGVERALEKGVELAPLRLDLAETWVKRLFERGAHAQAVVVLERAIEHAPKNPELRVRLAEALNRAGEPERALHALEAALTARAPEASVRRERARILETMGRADEALAELDVALHAEGGSGEELLASIERTAVFETSERWALRAADLYAEAGQRARARQLLAPWAEQRPESAQVLTRIGRLAAMDRDFPTALAAYKKVCKLEHGSARRTAVLAYARVAENAGRAEEAVAEVEASLAEGLDSVELRRELGKLYARTGDRLKQGRMLLEEARAAKPAQQLELFGKAAELLAAQGAPEEALGALAELRRLDPERSDVPVLTAGVLASIGRNEEGREVLLQVLAQSEKKRNRAHAKVFQKLAELMLAEDELAEAFEPLNQAHQLDKNDPEIALMLGLLAADLDQSETAFTALRVYVSLKEKSIDLATRRQLSRAYLQLGELELVKGQKTVARRMLTRAVETDPENKSAHRFLAELGPR